MVFATESVLAEYGKSISGMKFVIQVFSKIMIKTSLSLASIREDMNMCSASNHFVHRFAIMLIHFRVLEMLDHGQPS